MAGATAPGQGTKRCHNPLAQDLSEDLRPRRKLSTGKRKRPGADHDDDAFIDGPSSRKILAIAQDLADEEAASNPTTRIIPASDAFPTDAFAEPLSNTNGADSDPDESDWIPDEDVAEEDVNPSDLAVYNQFMQGERETSVIPEWPDLTTEVPGKPPAETESIAAEDANPDGPTNLADLILQRIADREISRQRTNPETGEDSIGADEIPPKVIEVFTKCGQLLSRYKSGPLPKPFKILPTLPSWPELLDITHPESWTPHAVLAATKIFISAPPAVAQDFVGSVLLDRVKEDIYETKKLNIHLYNALKKALYKPAAFFKGFLFPLVIQGCTLREATIISSVLVRVSIPALHSAAALLRLCEIAAQQSAAVSNESAGACNIFIRVLLEKKYALPYKAVDALVFHFLRFRNSNPVEGDTSMSGTGVSAKPGRPEDKLPVLWHQSLLVFAQRYKNDITEDQREALLDLLIVRGHREIGPEVRRELIAGRVRDGNTGPTDKTMAIDDGDDTMRGVEA